MTTGAEVLVRCLEREGVRYVFGVPGEETLDVNDALARSSIQFVAVRHEQGAAFMADVWGRLTGRAGVCLATLGPGATNLVTGVADANLDRAPVVAITGQLPRDLLHKESHQFVDIVDVFRPITKWNARIETRAVVAEAVRKAFKRAQEEKPGACHLELPEDVAREPAEGDRKSTRLNSSHLVISYAVFCLKKKKKQSHTCARTANKELVSLNDNVRL